MKERATHYSSYPGRVAVLAVAEGESFKAITVVHGHDFMIAQVNLRNLGVQKFGSCELIEETLRDIRRGRGTYAPRF